MMRTEEQQGSSSLQAGSLAPKFVLLVDDQKDERAIQRVLLEHLGYTVAEATDGEMALDMARKLAPDLVLLDIMIPKIDGLEVCKTLRADPRTSTTEVLFYTASAAGDNDERLTAIGGSGVLIKPLEPREVADAIARLIGPGTE